MKKYISCLLTLALFIPALVSCTRELQDDISQKNKHLVYFSTSNPETKTGLTIENGIVYPDWRETQLYNLHFFEMPVNGGEPSYGEALSIIPSVDNITAHFTASFTEDMTIIVNPSTRAGGSDMYYYGAVVAQKPDEDDLTFVIPAEQKPDAATLKDPDADFLIGYSRMAYEAYVDDENVVDLYFDRVAALGRLSFTNFKIAGEKVKSVTINSTDGLVGSAAYSDISFGDKNEVTFTRAAGPLTLSFGDGRAIPTEGAFEAYFVAIPGEATITSIEVLTDKYHYTKAIDGGKSFTFSNEAFKSINMDLDTAEAEEVSAVWYKTSMLEDGMEYLIVSQGYALKNNNGSTAGVSVTDNNGVITLDADPTIVWTSTAKTYTTGDNGEGGVVAGHFTLTNNGYYLRRQSNTDILLGTTVPSDKPKYVVWDYDGSYLKHESSETATFFCFYNNGWSTGYTSNGAAPGSDIKTVQIYTNRAPQVLSFDPAASAEYDLATPGWTVAVPTLTGAQTAVTYALSDDSNPAVATVDADGTVHPLSRGTVTVVATAAGNSQYQAASATYTLRVVDSSISINTYIKVTSTSDLEAGAQYLLVFEGLAGDTDGDGNPKVFKPILDGNNFSKTTSNAIDVEIESETIYSDEFEEYHLTLEAGYYLKANNVNRYIYPSGSNSGSGTLSAESSPSTALTISFSSGIVEIKAKSGTNYLVWSTSSHYFSSNASLSGQYSTGICLYKLDDGRLPQSPSFSQTTVSYDKSGSASLTIPTLSNYFGEVTYSSSDDSIASVDSSTGDVTVHKTGIVEITAHAAGNSQYRPGSASYTLTITDSNAPKYTKVTSAADLEDGAQYILVYETASKAFKPILNSGGTYFTKSTDNAVDVTISNGVIESSDLENCHITLENGYYLYIASAGKYLYPGASGDSALGAEDKTSGHTVAISFSDGIVTIARTSDSSYHLYWSSSSYFSGISSTSSSYAANICLYKLDDGRLPQSLSFSASAATYDLYSPSSFVKPTLSTAIGTVTYSSGDATIAEVDNSGNITGKKKGTVTITATAAGNTEYRPGSASYTLTIINSNASTTTYYRASSIEAGKEYLVVSSGMALTNNNGIASTSVTVTNDIIELDDADAMLWTAESKGSGFTLSNGGSYIQRASGSSGTPSVGAAPSDNYYIWAYDNANQYMYTASGTKYYLYYSSNNNRWSQSSSASTSHTVTLYTSDSGSSSGGGDDPEPQTQYTYTQITSVSELTDGASYLIVSSDANSYNGNDHQTLFAGDEAGNAVAVSASSGTITGAYSNYEFVISKSGSDYVLNGPNGYVTGNSGSSYSRYIQVSSSQVTMSLTDAAELSAAASGDGLVSDAFYFYYTKSGSKEVLYLNSDGKYKIGGSGRKYGVYLYKKADNP